MDYIDKDGLIVGYSDEVIGRRVTACTDLPRSKTYLVIANLGWTYVLQADDGYRFLLGAGKIGFPSPFEVGEQVAVDGGLINSLYSVDVVEQITPSGNIVLSSKLCFERTGYQTASKSYRRIHKLTPRLQNEIEKQQARLLVAEYDWRDASDSLVTSVAELIKSEAK